MFSSRIGDAKTKCRCFTRFVSLHLTSSLLIPRLHKMCASTVWYGAADQMISGRRSVSRTGARSAECARTSDLRWYWCPRTWKLGERGGGLSMAIMVSVYQTVLCFRLLSIGVMTEVVLCFGLLWITKCTYCCRQLRVQVPQHRNPVAFNLAERGLQSRFATAY